MFVAVARIVLQIPASRSLKEKRRVVRSYRERLRAKLPVSVAEIGELELHQRATLGVAVVSGDQARCHAILAQAVSLARVLPDAVLTDVATETISLGRGGSGIQGGIQELMDDPEWGADAPGGRLPAPIDDLPWGRDAAPSAGAETDEE